MYNFQCTTQDKIYNNLSVDLTKKEIGSDQMKHDDYKITQQINADESFIGE